jgi:opacity protein-like surface antigen
MKLNMKKLLLIAVLFFAGTVAYSQSYGIKAGMNIATLDGDDVDALDPESMIGYHVGFVAELRIFDNLTLQPELLYSIQGAELNNKRYELGYISLPVMAKFYLNDDLNLHLGPQVGFLVSESNEIDEDNSNTLDFGLAGGLEFFITDGLFIQARYSAGFSEIAEGRDITNSVYQVSLGYMF